MIGAEVEVEVEAEVKAVGTDVMTSVKVVDHPKLHSSWMTRKMILHSSSNYGLLIMFLVVLSALREFR